MTATMWALYCGGLIAMLAVVVGPTQSGYMWDLSVRSCALAPQDWIRTGFGINDRTLNVFMFAIPSLAGGYLITRLKRWAPLALLTLLPVVIETTHFALPFLGRTCATQDLADNYLGLLIGTVGGWVLAAVSRRDKA